MHLRPWQRIAALVTALSLFLLTPTSAIAGQNEDRLQEAQSKYSANKAQQDSVYAQIAKFDERMAHAAEDVDRLASDLKKKAAQRQDAERRLAEVRDELQKTRGQLSAAKKRLTQKKNVLDQRVKKIYANGGTSYLNVILGSRSFTDFLTRLSYVDLIAKQDARILKNVKQAKASMEAKEVELVQKDSAVENEHSVLVASERSIAQLKSQQELLVAALGSQKEQKQVLMDRLQKEQSGLAAEVADAQSQVDAERQANSSRGNDRDSTASNVDPLSSLIQPPIAASSSSTTVHGAIEAECARQGITAWCVEEIVDRESEDNPYAVNSSSGAAGLFQRLPGDSVVLGDIQGQVQDGVSYIIRVYGTSEAALVFWDTHGWY